jgi:hypothetical protein
MLSRSNAAELVINLTPVRILGASPQIDRPFTTALLSLGQQVLPLG